MAQVTVQETMAQLDWLSDRISTQGRWFAGGVIVLLWGLLVTPPATVKLSSSGLISVGLLAVSVLFFDFLQYVAGFLYTHHVHKEILKTPNQILPGYDTDDPRYQARTWFFWAKQVLGVFTFFGLLATLLPGLLK